MANMIQYHLIYISAIILLRSGRLYAQVAKPNTWQSQKSQGLWDSKNVGNTIINHPFVDYHIYGLPHYLPLITINHNK